MTGDEDQQLGPEGRVVLEIIKDLNTVTRRYGQEHPLALLTAYALINAVQVEGVTRYFQAQGVMPSVDMAEAIIFLRRYSDHCLNIVKSMDEGDFTFTDQQAHDLIKSVGGKRV